MEREKEESTYGKGKSQAKMGTGNHFREKKGDTWEREIKRDRETENRKSAFGICLLLKINVFIGKRKLKSLPT